MLPVVKGEYALLMRDLGDETAGRQWLEEFPPPEQSEQVLLRQFISLNPNHHLVFMKLLLAYQRWQEAEQLVKDQQALAEQQVRTGSLIQWLTIRAQLNSFSSYSPFPFPSHSSNTALCVNWRKADGSFFTHLHLSFFIRPTQKAEVE